MGKKSVASSLAFGVLLALPSCGYDGRDASTATKNLRAEIVANSAVAGTTSVTDDQAGCIAHGMVEQVGIPQLQEYDILTEDLKVNKGIENVRMSSSDAGSLADVFLGCVDVEELFQKQFAAGTTASALSVPQQTCVGDTVTEDVIRDILTDAFQGKQNDASARLQDQIVQCAVGTG